MGQDYRYASVAVCAAACWLIFLLRHRRKHADALPRGERMLIPLAMAGTLLADTFLVLLDAHYTAGVLCFCAVQTIYGVLIGLRLARQGSLSRANVLVRIVLLAAILAVLAALRALDLLSAAAAFSMAMLAANAVFAAVCALRESQRPAPHPVRLPAYVLFALGLFMFLGCDICMGLFNAPAYLPDFPAAVSRAAGRLIWVFYLPSQVLLAVSYALAGRDRREVKNGE